MLNSALERLSVHWSVYAATIAVSGMAAGAALWLGWPSVAAFATAIGYGSLTGVGILYFKSVPSEEPEQAAAPESGQNEVTVAPVTELINAHIDLVSSSTEAAAMQMSEILSDLRADLADVAQTATDPDLAQRAGNRAAELQMILQFQDIVRQQVEVVRHGLDTLSQAHIPEKDRDDAWIAEQIENLTGRYVMQDQWDVHNTHLGIATEKRDKDDDFMMF